MNKFVLFLCAIMPLMLSGADTTKVTTFRAKKEIKDDAHWEKRNKRAKEKRARKEAARARAEKYKREKGKEEDNELEFVMRGPKDEPLQEVRGYTPARLIKIGDTVYVSRPVESDPSREKGSLDKKEEAD